MTPVPKHSPLGVDEYLEAELHSQIRHEYLGGEVHAMAGGNNRHSAIASNILGLLFSDLRGRQCQAFNSDTKVRIELINQTRFYYPDAMVVCEGNKESEQYQDRPVVIFEVLSESTRRTDLAEKKEAYLTIPSLKVLMFVEPDEPFAVIYRRGSNGGFGREEYSGLDSVVPLPEIGAELALQEIYERLEFANR